MVSRGEVALNRAIEALRRLDSRHTHNSRLPVAHDVITQTNSPVFLVRFLCFVSKPLILVRFHINFCLGFLPKHYQSLSLIVHTGRMSAYLSELTVSTYFDLSAKTLLTFASQMRTRRTKQCSSRTRVLKYSSKQKNCVWRTLGSIRVVKITEGTT